MRIRCIQHVSFEGPAAIADWAEARGHELTVTAVQREPPTPQLDEFDALLVMGGPMSVHDERKYPWLKAEKRLIRAAIGNDRPVLGICLGAQLLAEALGASIVHDREPEIGWFPVHRLNGAHPAFDHLPDTFTPFHWHGERFETPPGATALAASPACPCQAFARGPHLGLQFHLEATPRSVYALTSHFGHTIRPGPYQQTAGHMLARNDAFDALPPLLEPLLDQFAAQAEAA